MTFFEYEQMQFGDAVRVTHKGSTRLLRITGKRNCLVYCNDGNAYEIEQCEPILLTDTQALKRLGFAEQFGMFDPNEHRFCFGWLDIYPSTHIAIWMNEYGYETKCYAGLKFLHQAQHKYRQIHNCELKLKYDK